MTEVLEIFASIGPEAVWTAFLIFARIGAAAALLPAFGEQALPPRIKLAGALSFGVLVAPMVWEQASQLANTGSWPMLIAAETIAGLAIGVFFRLLVIILQVTGAIAAQSTSLSQIFGPGLGPEPQPAFSTLLVVGGLALATIFGLHVYLTQAFMLSYEMFPLGQFISPADLSEWGLAQISRAFSLGFTLAAPFVITSVIYNFGLGIINRAMPQLMVAFVGAPAISFGGLALLLVASPALLSVWVQTLIAASGNLGTVTP